jgi:hypothetical protein
LTGRDWMHSDTVALKELYCGKIMKLFFYYQQDSLLEDIESLKFKYLRTELKLEVKKKFLEIRTKNK